VTCHVTSAFETETDSPNLEKRDPNTEKVQTIRRAGGTPVVIDAAVATTKRAGGEAITSWPRVHVLSITVAEVCGVEAGRAAGIRC